MTRLRLAAGVVLASLVAPFAHAAEDAQYVLKFSHVVSPQTPKGKAADWFAEQVNQRLSGRVRVEVFPNSQL